jgi:hypothetical protein
MSCDVVRGAMERGGMATHDDVVRCDARAMERGGMATHADVGDVVRGRWDAVE